MKPAREEDIPKVTHEGTGEILGVKVRIYRLDDGRSVIHADDFRALLDSMGMTPGDLDEILQTIG